MSETGPHPYLAEQRQRIDEIDRQLVSLLAQRFAVTGAVGDYTAIHAVSSRDDARERQHDRDLRGWAVSAGVSPELASKILRLILDEVVCAHDLRKGETA
jgi:chorismate mutase